MRCSKCRLVEILVRKKRKRRIRTVAFVIITLFIVYRFIFSILLISSNILITAHRGSTKLAPENTIASVVEAIALDVDFIEIDVQLSKDNQVFLLHDATFKRTANVNERASNLNYNEISKLNVGAYRFNKDELELISYRAPLLDEVIKVCMLSNVKLNIELKNYDNDEKLAYEVVKIIHENDFVDRCIISSYSQILLKKVKQLDPNLKIGLITSSTVLSTYVKCNFVDFYSINYASISPSIVMYIHSKNKEVHCWTPSSRVSISAAIHFGVDNIITNDVSLAKLLIVSKLNPEISNIDFNQVR